MSKFLDIPHLGKMFRDLNIDTWHASRPLPVPMLGIKCNVTVDNYENDPRREDFHPAIKHFLNAKPAVLDAAVADLYRYYKDCEELYLESDDDARPIARDELWKHVTFDDSPLITRRAHGDRGIYVTLECGCDWEDEHGLQIVLKNGERITKLGPYDGHLTNGDAYARKEFENVVYVGRDQVTR